MTEEPASGPFLSPTYVLGGVLYVVGAIVALCELPRLDDGIHLPLRGWAGVAGAVLLGVSPRAGVIRSLGLIGLWISGLFHGKHPIAFILGSSILLAGIALAHHGLRTPEVPADEEPEEEWTPPDGRAEWPGDDDPEE